MFCHHFPLPAHLSWSFPHVALCGGHCLLFLGYVSVNFFHVLQFLITTSSKHTFSTTGKELFLESWRVIATEEGPFNKSHGFMAGNAAAAKPQAVLRVRRINTQPLFSSSLISWLGLLQTKVK